MVSIQKVLAIALSLVALNMAPPPGKAALLRGYINHTQEAADTFQGSSKTPPVASESFPATYEGSWRCQTEVIDSAVPSVSVGQSIVCEIHFTRLPDGQVVASWNQPGWLQTQSSITIKGSLEACEDRINYYYGDGLNGAWAARCHDRFCQVGPDSIVSNSYVDQYRDGQYLGRYQTKSVLYRLGDERKLAQN